MKIKRVLYLLPSLLLLSNIVFASASTTNATGDCNTEQARRGLCVNTSSGSGARIAVSSRLKNAGQNLDLANLKEYKVAANTATAAGSAISLTLNDFQSIAKAGNVQLKYFAVDNTLTASMNIGSANVSTGQVWTLPANFSDLLDLPIRYDFINPADISPDLKFDGTSHMTRTVYNGLTYYDSYKIDNSQGEIEYLGLGVLVPDSYDLDNIELDNPDAASSSFSLIPLNLGSSYTFKRHTSEAGRIYEVSAAYNFDAFGTIQTPYGAYPALRFNATQTRKPLSGGTTQTSQRVGWVTQNGFVVDAAIASQSGIQATLRDFTMQRIFSNSQMIEVNGKLKSSELTGAGNRMVLVNNDGELITNASADISINQLNHLNFYPSTNTNFAIETATSSVYYSSATAATLTAPVNVPNGAKFTGFTIFAEDNSAGKNLTAKLMRQSLTGALTEVVDMTTSGSSIGFGSYEVTFGPYEVDLSNEAYFIQVTATDQFNGATSTWDNKLKLRSVNVVYKF